MFCVVGRRFMEILIYQMGYIDGSSSGNLSKPVDTKTTEHRNKKSPVNHQLVIAVLPWSIYHIEPPIKHQMKKIRVAKAWSKTS